MWLEGRLRSDDEGAIMFAEKLIPLEQLRKKMCGGLHIRFAADADIKLLQRVRKALSKHNGEIPLFLHIVSSEKTYRALSRECTTNASAALMENLREILGEDNVWIST